MYEMYPETWSAEDDQPAPVIRADSQQRVPARPHRRPRKAHPVAPRVPVAAVDGRAAVASFG